MFNCLLAKKGYDDQKEIWTNAIEKGDLATMDYLVNRRGFDMNCRISKGDTAIHMSVKKKNYRVIEWLVQNNANSHKLNKEGKTAHHLAEEMASLKMQEILEKGRK